MRINLNEIIVHRNETFTLDRYIANKDGSPFILSDELENAYIMIVVASNTYKQEGRYKNTWWLPLDEYPRFAETVPIDLDAITETDGGDPKYTDWPSSAVSGYLGSKLINDGLNGRYYVFSHTLSDGTVEYKHWVGTGYATYDFQFEHIFTQEETKKMGASEYLYSIFLAAGETTRGFLERLCDENGIPYTDTTTTVFLYEKLVQAGAMEGRDFNIDAPLGSFSAMIPLLSPTKMTVISNLEGAMQ